VLTEVQARAIVIVPAYNESASIARVLDDLSTHAPEYDVVVIDDGSTDATANVARAHGARVIVLPFNLGIGGAMQTGYRYAAEHGYDVAVQVDGDGQHDARSLSALADTLDADPSIDMVTGSRFMHPEGDGFQSSRSRRVGIRLFSALLSRIVGSPITDPTSGLRMVRRSGIELFARDYPHDYPEVEALVMMHAHRLKSVEIPAEMRPRLAGESSITASQSVYYMAKVTLAVVIALFRRRPVVEAGDVSPVAAEHGL
jgi:glycosyltransferase involved in cell wall biosynthesis